MRFREAFFRLSASAVAVSALAGQVVFAEESPGLKLRILAPRSASQSSANDSVVFEPAGGSPSSAQKPPVEPVNVKNKPIAPARNTTDAKSAKSDADRFNALATNKAAAQHQDRQASVAKQKLPATPPPRDNHRASPTPREQQYADAKSAGQKRQLALQRVNTLNQAAGPREAGVPQRSRPDSGESQVDGRRALAQTSQKPLPAPEPKASQPAAQVVEAAALNERMAPIPGAPTSSDPLASEIVRNGDSYTFTGSLNGIPVTFRINREITGVMIPTRLANVARIIPAEAKDGLKRLGEIVSPINSISFGAYPVRAVMAKIYVDLDEEYIDVGTDALNSFKIKDLNGRRMLVRS